MGMTGAEPGCVSGQDGVGEPGVEFVLFSSNAVTLYHAAREGARDKQATEDSEGTREQRGSRLFAGKGPN
jgi:hypothetical protein